MVKNKKTINTKAVKKIDIRNVNDVVEFYLGWNVHRETIKTIIQQRGLDENQTTTLDWVIDLIDRISEEDLEVPG
ncbi:MAG: hypothetical protein JKY49_17950 [Cohaesibacteraceae bacterium]|nr:hypothetical protein [Cohaesibacteraceae bacterium]PCH79998.1 MAG: hypothetical protein COB90_10030 [Hyphomicrobiales bacterium]